MLRTLNARCVIILKDVGFVGCFVVRFCAYAQAIMQFYLFVSLFCFADANRLGALAGVRRRPPAAGGAERRHGAADGPGQPRAEQPGANRQARAKKE